MRDSRIMTSQKAWCYNRKETTYERTRNSKVLSIKLKIYFSAMYWM